MLTERIPPLSPARAALLGGLVVGTLDIGEVIVFYATRGVPPIRVLQSVASGLLGVGAYGGGVSTALLGLALHFVIAFAVVAVYLIASRALPALARAPLAWGALYGLAVYGVMTYAVVPLSAAVVGPPALAATINGIAIHVLGIGIPSALFATAAHRWRVGHRPAATGRAAVLAPM
ncbi:MAG TPA: hypothetical protein VLK84_17750 [Longimicrobium sp.]|nr:hypothetical protein [Longimicrobium sp.]